MNGDSSPRGGDRAIAITLGQKHASAPFRPAGSRHTAFTEPLHSRCTAATEPSQGGCPIDDTASIAGRPAARRPMHVGI